MSSLGRFAVTVGILERPMVQGLIWGIVTGDMTLALSVSAFFELFWLDLIPAGTFIPPNAAAANLAALTLVHFFGFSTPAEVVFPLLFSLPLGWIAARVEYLHRNFQNASYNSLQAQVGLSASPGDYAPGRLVRRSIMQMGVLSFAFFEASVLVLIVIVNFFLMRGFLHLPADAVTWGHLWIAASIGPLLSLRSAKAYALIFVLAGGIAALAALGTF
ncbi:PTS sugar transporter subunit IIC [Desulfobaculum sp. SPO524]|uniref:PTS sugar transporter subunit IIC n=1 Tax=Desulfobaculum sp. SPO524 TaxID=3378071 RepID=UPI0038525FD7